MDVCLCVHQKPQENYETPQTYCCVRVAEAP